MKRILTLALVVAVGLVSMAARADATSGKDLVNMIYAPCGNLVSTGQYYYLEQGKPIPVLGCIPLATIKPGSGAWSDIAHELILRDGTVIPWSTWWSLVNGGTVQLQKLWASAGYRWRTQTNSFLGIPYSGNATMCGLLGRTFRSNPIGDVVLPTAEVLCQSKSWSFNPFDWDTFTNIGRWLLDPTGLTRIAQLPTELRPREITGIDKLMSGLLVSAPTLTQSLVTAKLDNRGRVRPMLTTTSTTTPSTQVADTGASSTIKKMTGIVCVFSCTTFTYDVPMIQEWYKARTAF